MERLLRSMSIAASLLGAPTAVHALDVVHWGEQTLRSGGPASQFSPLAPPSWQVLAAAPQHAIWIDGPGAGRPPARRPASSREMDPGSAGWTGTPREFQAVSGVADSPAGGFEGGGHAPLLAGLAAAALLMWRRLRRN